MKTYILGFVFCTVTLFGSTSIKDSIVKVYSTATEYSYKAPWSPPMTRNATGSGCVIEGNRILTNAHVVSGASFIEVKSATSNEKYEAVVKVIGHDCDLAILELEDPEFFEGKTPLNISSSIAIQREEVQVYGFPRGGTGLSITKGIVSRVEMGQYAHSSAFLLLSQIDAPLNPGNSGGPVISGGEVVGIAHQGFSSGQNIGYMIPVPIIHHFLKEVESLKVKEEYKGFPNLPLKTQTIRNPGMRSFYGLEENTGGLLVTYIPENHFLFNAICPGDILIRIDQHDIDPFGCVAYPELGLTLPFDYEIMMKYFGDEIDLEILRDGKKHYLNVKIDETRRGAPLVRMTEYDKPPTYYIVGGMVFQPLVGNMLENYLSFGGNFLFIDLMHHCFRGKVEGSRDEIVVLSRVLKDRVNEGYQLLENEVIKEVNGIKICNMQDLIQIFENSQDTYFVIETQDNEKIILDRDEVVKRSPLILQRYFISSERSEDLKSS